MEKDVMYNAIGKRSLDIILAGLLLLAALPIIVITALVVRLTSDGPVIFSQPRVGKNGNHFDFYKFRSMYIDQDSRVDINKITEDKKQGILFKHKSDPRVTHVGRWLRKTSIDELPQLYNILCGDMSLIGPRPLVPYMLEPYPEIAKLRNSVRPGLTGLWQICNRHNNRSLMDMESYDLDYINRLSLKLDLVILFKTPFKLMDGAH